MQTELVSPCVMSLRQSAEYDLFTSLPDSACKQTLKTRCSVAPVTRKERKRFKCSCGNINAESRRSNQSMQQPPTQTSTGRKVNTSRSQRATSKLRVLASQCFSPSTSRQYFTNAFLCTNPTNLPSLNTQIYLNPSLTKHSYTKSIGEQISSATGATSM